MQEIHPPRGVHRWGFGVYNRGDFYRKVDLFYEPNSSKTKKKTDAGAVLYDSGGGSHGNGMPVCGLFKPDGGGSPGCFAGQGKHGTKPDHLENPDAPDAGGTDCRCRLVRCRLGDANGAE